jgi:hypothetical protein
MKIFCFQFVQYEQRERKLINKTELLRVNLLKLKESSTNNSIRAKIPRSIRRGRKQWDTPFSDRLRQLLTVYDTTKNGLNAITTKWAIYTP